MRMKNTRSSRMETEPKPERLPPIWKKYSTILKPRMNDQTMGRTSIMKEDIEIDEKNGIPRLVHHQRRRLVKNIFFVSLAKTATYLSRDVITNNWIDPTLTLVGRILSTVLLSFVTPLFVPLVLRTFTVRSSLRLGVLWMTVIVLTTYRPYPYIFILQIVSCTFPESVLRVAIPLYMIRIAKIWSRNDGVALSTTILRVFALNNLLFRSRHILVSTIKYIQPDIYESRNSILGNATDSSCGFYYCVRTKELITEYLYDVKYKNFEEAFTLSIVLGAGAALIAVTVTVLFDRLDALSKLEFGQQPTAYKTIDVFLQLCRPRMTYLLGMSLYQPFLRTLRHGYLEAYATCALRTKYDHSIVIVVSIAAIHATLSAEILLDILGIIGTLQLVLIIFTGTFIFLCLWNELQTLNVLPIFLVFYIIQYWISIYELFVVLLTHRVIGDQEIAAWGIHATIFSTGLTLSQAFHYMCMNAKLKIMILFGIAVLLMTFFLRREIKKTFLTIAMNEKIVEAFRGKSRAWISDSHVDLSDAIHLGGALLWIETFWRRTVYLVNYPTDDHLPVNKSQRKKKESCNFIERRSDNTNGGIHC